MTRRDTAFAGIAIAALSFIGFANPLWQIPLAALALPAGLYCVALGAPSPRVAFVRGLLVGGLAYTACLYWVAVPVHDYGLLPWVLAAPCPVLLGMAMGVYAGVFAASVRLVGSRFHAIPAALSAGVIWGALEALRGVLFTGFTWLCLPSAFVPWPAMLQTASIVGAQGLAVALAALACLPAAALMAQDLRRSVQLGCGAAAFAGFAALWFVGINGPLHSVEETRRARVLLVQGDINQSLKWDPAYQRETVERYIRLTTAAVGAAGHRPDLVVWPETAMPFYFQENSVHALRVRQLADTLDVPLLLGSPGYERDATGLRYYNRAFLLDADGETTGIYDKEHLVPFGEYIPFGEYLPIDKLVHGVGDFAPGDNPRPLTLPEDSESPGLGLGVLICYETIFPALARTRTQRGATVLVNISNDAWFGRTSAPLQHLHLSALRAVEQGRTLLRATNTGITAVVSPDGRIRSTTPLFEQATVTAEVGLYEGLTPYGRHGGLVLPALVGMSIVLVLFALRRQPEA